MALPPFAEIRFVRLHRALSGLGLQWITSPEPPRFELIGDWFEIEGVATWDDHAYFKISERIDVRESPDPIRYEYGLSFVDSTGQHQRREIHFHEAGRRRATDVCHEPCHRHAYVGTPGGSERPKVPPCVCVDIEDALAELAEIYFFQGFPPGGSIRLRGVS